MDTPEPQDTRRRAPLDWLVAGLAVVLTAAALAWAADLYRAVGLLLYPQQYLAGVLAVALPLIFLVHRLHRRAPAERLPWYDAALALAGFFAPAYMAVRYPVLAELVQEMPTDGLVSGTIVLLLVVEGLRRTVGMVLTAVVAFFLVLALVGHHLPGSLAGRQTDLGYLLYYLAWDPTAMLGTPMVVVSTIVLAFVFFGQVLLKSGGSEFFTEASMVLVGRFRGGQAKIAVTASGLFGSISGSAVSNVATTGVITIPLMRSGGYDVHLAGAIEAVASTGGQLMPPIMGAAAFLMAEFLQIAYTEVVLAALIPAILYYVALFILADLEAAKSGIRPVDKSEIPDGRQVVRTGWFFPLPFAVLIGALFWLNYTPEYSALLSAVALAAGAAVFGYKGRRLGLRQIYEAFRGTGIAVLDIIMIGAAAGMVIGVLGMTGLGFALTLSLVHLGGGNLFVLLILAALICIILGMGMPTAGVYILLATLVAPSLVEVGIEPIAAHLFILYFGMMSMITPPVAIAAFAAASLTGADAMRTGFAAMRFGWVAYLVPFLFVASPSLLMQGSAAAVVTAALTAVVGVWIASIAIVGYFVRRLGAGMRLLFAAAGLAMFVPAGAFAGGVFLDIAGAALAAALVTREILAARERRRIRPNGPR